MGISITFFVPGESQPFPKKRTDIRTGMIYSYDPADKKHPAGKKKRWTEKVRLAAIAAKPKLVKKPNAIKINATVYLRQPKSNKNTWPVGRPDLDNLFYVLHNACIGICYEDDSQIVHVDERKVWATETVELGMLIAITELE